MQLTAIIAKPGDDTMETITAQGDTYDNASAALDANLPDGWRMLSIRRW